MKVLHVGESVLGGAGTHINELAPIQQRLLGLANVAVLIPAEHRHHISDPTLKNIFTFSRPNRKSGLFHLLHAYIKIVRTFRPDLIHAHSTFAGLITRILYPFLRTPIIYCPHGWAMDMDQSVFKKRLIDAIEYTLSFLCQKIIAVSENERRRGIEIGIAPKKIVTVQNGIAPDAPSVSAATWNDERLKVLFVGRLDKQKGVDVLLRAIKGLEDRLALRIIGDSVAEREEIDFSLYPHVTCLGWQKQDAVAMQMMACDVMVMPSRWEGLPIAAIEAMRLSKPIIASSVGGLPEVIADGKSGILFPVNDYETLATILRQADRKKLQEMGQAGYSRFLELFTSDRMAAEIEKVYDEEIAKLTFSPKMSPIWERVFRLK